MYAYVKLIQFVVQQKVTQHCKSTILQLKKFLNKENDQNCVINTLKLGDERKERL